MKLSFDIFKIPLYSTHLDIENNKLLYSIKSLKSDIKFKSNMGGFQSMLPLNNPEIKKFSKIILKEVNIFSTEIGLKNINRMSNIWINVNHFKDSNLLHSHPLCALSGVYYIKTPEDCGNIQFVNPVTDFIDIEWNKNILKHNNYNSSQWSIKPEVGKLILFPSWLKHFVEPNLNKNNPRVSLSFNLT